jgi:hypothetical protein
MNEHEREQATEGLRAVGEMMNAERDDKRDKITREAVRSTVRVKLAKVLAETIVLTIADNQELGNPLNQKQQASLIECALLAFEHAPAEIESSIMFETRLLSRLGPEEKKA